MLQQLSATANALVLMSFAVLGGFAAVSLISGHDRLTYATQELLKGMVKVSAGVIYMTGYYLAGQLLIDYDPAVTGFEASWVVEWRWTRIVAAVLVAAGVIRMIFAVWQEPKVSRIGALLLILAAGAAIGVMA